MYEPDSIAFRRSIVTEAQRAYERNKCYANAKRLKRVRESLEIAISKTRGFDGLYHWDLENRNSI